MPAIVTRGGAEVVAIERRPARGSSASSLPTSDAPGAGLVVVPVTVALEAPAERMHVEQLADPLRRRRDELRADLAKILVERGVGAEVLRLAAVVRVGTTRFLARSSSRARKWATRGICSLSVSPSAGSRVRTDGDDE